MLELGATKQDLTHSLSALAGKRKGRDLVTVFDSEPESDYVLEQLQKFRL